MLKHDPRPNSMTERRCRFRSAVSRVLLSSATAAVLVLDGSAMASEPGSSGSPSQPPAGREDPATFENVTVSNPNDTSSKPKVTAESKLPAARLKWKDLVVGKGEAATPASSVTVHYVGVRYSDGKQFDSSWDKRGPATFRLNKVVKGFSQGIGGTDEIPPMRAGGRRIMILPSELAYAESGTPDGSIPPNATIVFVVDLIAVK
jgi:peptidylprolyl isomerase